MSTKQICPVCETATIPENVLFTCRQCWWKLPGDARTALSNMVRRGQPTAEKLASVVRKFKKKQAKARMIILDDPNPPNPVDVLKSLGFDMDPKMEEEARRVLEEPVYADGVRNDLPGIQKRFNTRNAIQL